MSRRSSVDFHRPKSFVMCRGCLLFFTLLVMGAGFTTMVRGGVRAPPDFVTWVTWTHTKYPLKWGNLPIPLNNLWTLQLRTFFFSVDEGSLPEQRTGSMTGGPLTRLEDLTKLLSTSSSSNFFLLIDLIQRQNYVFGTQNVSVQKRFDSNLEELLRLGTPLPKACAAVLFTSFTPSDSSSSDRLWAPATPIGDPTTGSPACICPDTTT